MPTLPEPILRAAARWLERLPASEPSRCRALFTTHAEFSDISPTQYDSAYSWLRETRLLEELHSPASAQQRVFEAALMASNAPWLYDADRLIPSSAELPVDVLQTAASLGIGEPQAYQQVMELWGKVNTDERIRIGSAGESALVEILRSSTKARIEHVALHSDGYGYDIEVLSGEHTLHIETKSTTRHHRTTIFLSRHEYETMQRDSNWQLVVVRLSDELHVESIASIPTWWIAGQVPRDVGLHGRWESCSLEVPSTEAAPGIQRLAAILFPDHSPLLDGSVSW